MNKNAIKAIVLTVALTFSSVGYVDAKRMGSGKNMGQSAPVQKQAQPAQAQLWSCRRAVSRDGFARLGLSMQQSGFVRHVAAYESCIAPWAMEPMGAPMPSNRPT